MGESPGLVDRLSIARVRQGRLQPEKASWTTGISVESPCPAAWLQAFAIGETGLSKRPRAMFGSVGLLAGL